jgi:hypothetical protein
MSASQPPSQPQSAMTASCAPRATRARMCFWPWCEAARVQATASQRLTAHGAQMCYGVVLPHCSMVTRKWLPEVRRIARCTNAIAMHRTRPRAAT